MKRIATGILLVATLTMAGQASAWGGGHGHGGGGHRGGGGNVVGALLGGAVVGALVGSAFTRNYYEPPVVYSAPQPVYVQPPQVVYEVQPRVVYAQPPQRCFDTYRQEYVPCYSPRPRHRDYPPADQYYGDRYGDQYYGR